MKDGIDILNERIAELEAENKRLRDGLEMIISDCDSLAPTTSFVRQVASKALRGE